MMPACWGWYLLWLVAVGLAFSVSLTSPNCEEAIVGRNPATSNEVGQEIGPRKHKDMKRHPGLTSQSLPQVIRTALVVVCMLSALVIILPAQTQTLTVLHNFAGQPTDGGKPTGGLLFDPAGNLYGVTHIGGAADSGTVFKLDPNGTESLLHSFAGPPDGNLPSAGLARDAAGNLYGVTSNGGSLIPCPNFIGCGIVFKLDPVGTETVLHRFGSNGPDGTGPLGRLTLDNSLNLFGTTEMGSHKGCKIFIGKNLVDVGCGTVFKVDASGTESILYSFINATDGAFPRAGLAQDASGNLFGTASTGGVMNCASALFGKCGTVFQLDTAGQFSMLYSFQGASNGPDGGTPESSLLLDAAGNLFGTTNVGGNASPCFVGETCGTIFQLTPAGKETLVHSFGPGDGAAMPTAGMVQDAAGNFYGLSSGNVFKLDSTGKESVLFTFTGNDNQASGELVQDASGNLYGVTPSGTSGFGTVFKLTTPPDFALAGITLTPATVKAGGSATAAVDLVPVSGFNDTVTLACSVSPTPAQAPQCSVPASATPGTQVNVMVSTSGPSAAAVSRFGTALSYALWLPLLGLVGIGSRFGSKQRKIGAMLLGCVLFAGVVFQVACGGGGSSGGGNSGTPAGTYTITLTGTSSAATGSLVRSTSAPLQVQ